MCFRSNDTAPDFLVRYVKEEVGFLKEKEGNFTTATDKYLEKVVKKLAATGCKNQASTI